MRAITLLLLALVLVVGATTVTFQPDATVGKDAFCYEDTTWGCRDRSPGNSVALASGSMDSHFGHYYCCSYIEFTELNDSAYQGASVASATLWLYVTLNESDWSYHQLGAANREWDEGTITWHNRPGLRTGSGIAYSSGDDNSWIQVDVTNHVQKWLDGIWENYGFILTDAAYYRYWCRSSDYGDPALHPKLVMNYSGSAVEEATWGQIKATF